MPPRINRSNSPGDERRRRKILRQDAFRAQKREYIQQRKENLSRLYNEDSRVDYWLLRRDWCKTCVHSRLLFSYMGTGRQELFFFWSGHDQSVFVTGKLGFLAPRAPASFPREFNANSMTDDPAKGLLPNPYDGPKLLTSYSMHGNDSYVLEDLSKYISSIVKTRTRKHVESLLQNKSWLKSDLRYFGDVSFSPVPVLVIC